MKTCRFVPSQKIGAFTLYRFYVFSTWWRLVPNMDSLPSEPGGSFDCPIQTNRNRPGKKIHVFPGYILDVGPPSSNSDRNPNGFLPVAHWEGGHTQAFFVSSRISGFPGFLGNSPHHRLTKNHGPDTKIWDLWQWQLYDIPLMVQKPCTNW